MFKVSSDVELDKKTYEKLKRIVKKTLSSEIEDFEASVDRKIAVLTKANVKVRRVDKSLIVRLDEESLSDGVVYAKLRAEIHCQSFTYDIETLYIPVPIIEMQEELLEKVRRSHSNDLKT